jgi:hypothetical protein
MIKPKKLKKTQNYSENQSKQRAKTKIVLESNKKEVITPDRLIGIEVKLFDILHDQSPLCNIFNLNGGNIAEKYFFVKFWF